MPSRPLNRVLHHLRRAAVRRETTATDRDLLAAFVARRDEMAFEALVRRHGAMVLGVCRRLLGRDHDAEDAFQATFLVLARRAAAVRPREPLGNWLYGVACRCALAARRSAARRQATERQVSAMPEPPAPASSIPSDLSAVLDEELARLPEKYRAAVVLCEVEGQPRHEAAKRLGIPEGTLSSRLATARKQLAARLRRRGLAPAIALATLSAASAGAAVPARLLSGTITTATGSAAAVSQSVSALTEEVMKAMFLSKLQLAAVSLAAAGLLAVGAVAAYGWPYVPPDRPPQWETGGIALSGRNVVEARDALRDTLLLLDKQFWEATSKHDIDTLKKLMADDCVFLVPNLSRWGKAEWLDHLRQVRSSDPQFGEVQFVRLGTGAAILAYHARWKVHAKDGIGSEMHRRLVWGWEQKDGGWLIKYLEVADVEAGK
jgi:uncharacterized protein (TIGR02246 family)